ncbi:hypothetical protein Poly51_09430 [Rubripirellula tenax]|uniref:Uncharacterized protein n=1 Tax=Rubripirellula tenax TaxID=2528015 RepID=A0A5C6FJA7_9BACT|nr:hypothetical protein Poly51_09430 [Rubripirellula tenax]
MPRPPRADAAGEIYHVLNRGRKSQEWGKKGQEPNWMTGQFGFATLVAIKYP